MLCSTANPLLSHTLSAIQFWCPIASNYPKKKKKGGGGRGVCPKYRIFICFWWFVWFRNLQLRWHGGICKEAGQECKEEEGAFHQEIFQTKKQLATEASTDFCPSSFVLVHVCMFILKNWARCAFSASYMMTFLCTVYIHIAIYTRGLRLFHMPAMSQLSPLALGDGASHHIQCALCIFKFSKTLCRCIRHLDIPEPMHTLAWTEITFNIGGIYMYGGCHEEIGKVFQLK